MLGTIAKSKVELVLDGKIVDSGSMDLPTGDTELGSQVRQISQNLMVAALRIAMKYVIDGKYEQGLSDLENLINSDCQPREPR